MGGKGGSPKTATPEPQYQDTAADEQARAMEEMKRAMLEQQRQFQEELKKQAERAARLKKEAEEREATRRREKAYDDIELLTTSRLEAEETAISSVDQELAQEQSQAELRGVDFNVTEEQRMARIQSRFDEFWDVRYETELSDLVGQFGGAELTPEERLLIEKGERQYLWAPETKRTGFEYKKDTLKDDKLGGDKLGEGSEGERFGGAPPPPGKKGPARGEGPERTAPTPAAADRARRMQQRSIGGADMGDEGFSLLGRAGDLVDAFTR